MKGLSIVIPAYNEERNVADTVREVSEVARQLPLDHEILVVNDGSRDRTGEVVRGLAEEIPSVSLIEHFPNRGYGGALKAGFTAANYDLITFVPADGQFTFTEIGRFLAVSQGADVVCGYRAIRQDNLMRRLNGWGWNTVVRLMFGYLARDIDCGFKLLRREVLDRVPLPSDGAMIDTQLLAGARARGLRIVDVPVTHLPRVAGEATGASPRVIARAFKELVLFRIELSREMRAAGQNARLTPQPARVPAAGKRERSS